MPQEQEPPPEESTKGGGLLNHRPFPPNYSETTQSAWQRKYLADLVIVYKRGSTQREVPATRSMKKIWLKHFQLHCNPLILVSK